jgi:hypothetical protein
MMHAHSRTFVSGQSRACVRAAHLVHGQGRQCFCELAREQPLSCSHILNGDVPRDEMGCFCKLWVQPHCVGWAHWAATGLVLHQLRCWKRAPLEASVPLGRASPRSSLASEVSCTCTQLRLMFDRWVDCHSSSDWCWHWIRTSTGTNGRVHALAIGKRLVTRRTYALDQSHDSLHAHHTFALVSVHTCTDSAAAQSAC